MSRELRIGVTGMSTAGGISDPYAGVNLAAAENPNFVDAMTHWTYNNYYGNISATMGLPMEFTPDPAITTGCKIGEFGGYNSGGSSPITQDLVAIPEGMRASLPCNFTASCWRLQVGGTEQAWIYFKPVLSWYDESQSLLGNAAAVTSPVTDLHAWQYQQITALVPATAYYLTMLFVWSRSFDSDMYYTACRLERDGVSVAAPTSPSFAVSRDSAGILIGVRDNAAPQFAVSRDSGGLSIMVPR